MDCPMGHHLFPNERTRSLKMQFDKNIPIYIQIEDFIQDRIINKIWLPMERIPSVRELAETLEVNPNTVIYNRNKVCRFP